MEGVRHREALDLEFVLHTGDVVSWDTPGHEQYERASVAMRAYRAKLSSPAPA